MLHVETRIATQETSETRRVDTRRRGLGGHEADSSWLKEAWDHQLM
jgi:hypothetical protein